MDLQIYEIDQESIYYNIGLVQDFSNIIDHDLKIVLNINLVKTPEEIINYIIIQFALYIVIINTNLIQTTSFHKLR